MEKIVAIQYCTMSFLCVVLLSYIMHTFRISKDDTRGFPFLKFSLFFSIIFALADIAYALREFDIIDPSLPICYFTEIVYSLSSILCAYCWFVYSEIRQESRSVRNKRNLIIHSIPMLIMGLITITTPIHGMAFAFDENKHYIRGLLNTPITIVATLFIVETGISGYIRSKQKKYYIIRNQLKSLSLYAIIIVVTQIIQIAVGSIMPFRTIGATILFFIVREVNISHSITRDSLTKINNRAALEQYLETQLDNADSSFFFAMFDLDDFKRINDQHGHIAGDNALKIFAEALKISALDNHFVARYGGDEFAATGFIVDESQIEELAKKLKKNIDMVKEKYDCSIPISFSYGYVLKDDSINTIPDLIDAADKKLYQMKKLSNTQKG